MEHHSCCTVKRGKCKWENCPGCNRDDLTDRDRPVQMPYTTHITAFNAVCNLERIPIFAMTLVLMVPEIAMLYTTKKKIPRERDW